MTGQIRPSKTYLLNIARSDATLLLQFEEQTLWSQDEVEILGITYDKKLNLNTFNILPEKLQLN